LTITSHDFGNTGAGGALTTVDTVDITVNPINDPPTSNVPGPQVTDEDTNIVFSNGNGNEITVDDVAAGPNTIRITMSVTHGRPHSPTITVDITVNAVNDAPVITLPIAQSTNEDTDLVLSTANGNLISIGDVDVANGLLQVTLTATNGKLTLAGLSGLAFSVG